MTMTVSILDSIEDRLFTIELKDDVFCECVRRGDIKPRPKILYNGDIGQELIMSHLKLIDLVNEMAL